MRKLVRTSAPPPPDAVPDRPVRIGVSSCLLGESVRYDGGHKRDAFLVGTLGSFVEWVPVCPEVELGLGTARDTLRLERRGGAVRLVVPSRGRDLTDAVRSYAERRVAQIERLDLFGYVLKKGSPSCGMERVKVYDGHGVAARNGHGLFAEVLLERLPDLPVEDEGRLSDPRLRENFIQRVFARHRLRGFFYVSERLAPEERAEMVSLIEDYRQGLVPLIVPMTLVRRHVRRLEVAWLLGQVYLQPHPRSCCW